MSNRYIGGVVTETTNVDQSPWSGAWTEQAAMQSFGSVLRVTNSLRFRSSASAYLNRTFGTPTNTYKFTFSFWMKRGLLSAQENFLGSNTYPNYMVVSINASDQLAFVYGGTNAYGGYTTAVFRDPSAWYHIVYSVDTTQATDSNRVKIYVNGVQQTSITTIPGVTATYPPQNTANPLNSSGMVNEMGATNYTGTNTQFFDGYLADINFIDGQALAPTAFGAINKENGVWAPIAYTGTYGLNGFHLTFNNTTSTTTLGYDSSGNGNNWTTNNISLTAGSTYDSMIDSPSKFPGSSYGVGNYAVLNPLYRGYGAYTATPVTLSNANLTLTGNPSANNCAATISLPTTGQFYYEYVWTANSGGEMDGGIIGDAGSAYFYRYDGTYWNGSAYVSYGASYTVNDVIGVAVDMTNLTFTFYKNGVSQGLKTAAFPAGVTYFPWFYVSNTTAASVNFGQRPFAYTPPTGYKTLCTQNLPVVAIYNGAQYMAATTFVSQNGQTVLNTVNGDSFQPDFLWVKRRNNVGNNFVFDSVRGVSKYLVTNDTAAEVTNAAYLLSLNSNGFTLGTGIVPAGGTAVGWQWKAGGTAVTNTAGSITSQVSANTTAGFSVVTYTGNGNSYPTGATVGHGLGVAPQFIIIKSRSTSGTNWPVWHIGLSGADYTVLLNDTGAQASGSWAFNQTLPTSAVFSVGQASGGSRTNESAATYVAYCFAAIAGYSAFGSYTGNGSTDGPFVYCGFRPRFLLVKSAAGTSAGVANWLILDTSRSPSNVADYKLAPNLSEAENGASIGGAGSNSYDILSNGFKARTTNGSSNENGSTFIYAAFAENPFQNSLAR